jgi:hypothetical protein
VFGATPRIASIQSLTQFTATVNHATAGAITFTVGGATNFTADGGGITLKGTTDKTLNWVNSTLSWTSSENFNVASTKTYKIAGTDVLSATNVLQNAATATIGRTSAAATVNVGAGITGNILNVGSTAAGTATIATSVTTGTVNLVAGTTTGTVNLATGGASTTNIGGNNATVNVGGTGGTAANLNVRGTASVNALVIDGATLQDYNTVTVASTAATQLAAFAVATYGSGEFLVQATQGVNRQISKILVVHNGTIADATEFGMIQTGARLFNVEVDISSSNVRLLVTSTTTSSTVYRTSYTLIGA